MPSRQPLLRIAHFVNSTREEIAESFIYSLCVANHAAFESGRLEQKIICLADKFVEIEPDDKQISVFILPYSSVLLGTREWCTFDLTHVIRDCMLVHVHEPFTKAGETAFTMAKNCNLPCVITCEESSESSLAWKWGMARCADAIFCSSESRALELERSTDTPIIVVNAQKPNAFEWIAPVLVRTYAKLALQLEHA